MLNSMVTVSQLDSMDIQILSGSHLALTSDAAGSGIGVSPRCSYFTSAKKGTSGGAPLTTPPLLDLGTALRSIIGLSLPPREPAPAEIQPLPSPNREKARATERFLATLTSWKRAVTGGQYDEGDLNRQDGNIITFFSTAFPYLPCTFHENLLDSN